MHLSKSTKKARGKLEAKVKKFEKNYCPSADDFADYEEAKVELEKIYDHTQEMIFVICILKKFGFGKDFVQWTKTLFKNSQSCVMNNGTSTGYFRVERGTRQGDPLSPYLFILTFEILFIKVRNDSSIKGFWINKLK